MTQVTRKKATWVFVVVLLAAAARFASGQSAANSVSGAPPPPPTAAVKPAEELYLELRNVGLDPARTYHIRNAPLDRPALHIMLEDGKISFTTDVAGRVTGAFFEGDGDLLLTPPNQVERASMALFTGMAILEQRFTTAYLAIQ